MTTFLLLPFIAYAIAELRAVRRRERKLWVVLEHVAVRIDDLSVELALLASCQAPLPTGVEGAAQPGYEPDDDAGPPRPLRVVNGGK